MDNYHKVQCINGWTKKRVLARIKKYVKGCSVNESGGCAYETEQGNRCAIGAFLDHRRHSKEIFDYKGPILSLIKHRTICHTLPFSLDTLSTLQCIHDKYNQSSISYAYLTPQEELIAWIEKNVEDDTSPSE